MFISSKLNVISALAGSFVDDVEVFALRLQDANSKKREGAIEKEQIEKEQIEKEQFSSFPLKLESFPLKFPNGEPKFWTIPQYTRCSKATSNPFQCQEGDVEGNYFAERPFFMTTEQNAEAYTKTKYLEQWGCTQLLHVLTGTEFQVVNLRNTEFLKEFVSYYNTNGDVEAVNSIKLITGYDVTDREQYNLAKACMRKLEKEQKSKEYKTFDLRKLKEKIDGEFVKYDGKDKFTYITGKKVKIPEAKNKDTLNRLCVGAKDNEVLRLLKKFVEDEQNEKYANVMGYFWVGDKKKNNWWHSKGCIIDEVALFQQYMEDKTSGKIEKKALWITDAEKYLKNAGDTEAEVQLKKMFSKKTSPAFLEFEERREAAEKAAENMWNLEHVLPFSLQE